MSQTLQRPGNGQPQAKPLRTDPIAIWKAKVYREKGWKSKAVEQGGMKVEMDHAIAEYEENAIPAGSAQALKDRDLDPGKEFKAYLKALETFEGTNTPRPKDVVAALRAAAQGYIDHYEKHSDRQKKQSKTEAKSKACEKTLRDLARYDQVADLRALGEPPWDAEKQMKAATLKTTLDFEGLDEPGAERTTGGGVNMSFWFNKAEQDGQSRKSYIFKPALEKPGDVDGFPKGAEAMREAMTGRAADLLGGMMGLNLGAPETHVISVDQSHFKPKELDAIYNQQEALLNTGLKRGEEKKKVDRTQPINGSLQQLVTENAGEMRQNDFSTRKKIRPEDCQKIAILDTVTMNMDRHGGNVMLTKDDPPGLVPIDHGLTFPPPDSIESMPERLGNDQNAMLSIPGMHEPFTPEMLAAIGKLDPDAVVAGLDAERQTLDQVHDGGGTAKLSNETLEMTRRSSAFLKLAAPSLSPAAVQITMAQNAARLFDPALNDSAFKRLAQDLIVDAAAQQGDFADWFTMPREQQQEITSRLTELGWPAGDLHGKTTRWMLKNLKFALRAYGSDTRNPDRAVQQKPPPQPLQNVRGKLTQIRLFFPDYEFDENDADQLQEAIGLWDGIQGLRDLPTKVDELKQAYPDYKFDETKPAELLKAIELWDAVKGLTDVKVKVSQIRQFFPKMKFDEKKPGDLRSAVEGWDKLQAVRDVDARIKRAKQYLTGFEPTPVNPRNMLTILDKLDALEAAGGGAVLDQAIAALKPSKKEEADYRSGPDQALEAIKLAAAQQAASNSMAGKDAAIERKMKVRILDYTDQLATFLPGGGVKTSVEQISTQQRALLGTPSEASREDLEAMKNDALSIVQKALSDEVAAFKKAAGPVVVATLRTSLNALGEMIGDQSVAEGRRQIDLLWTTNNVQKPGG